MHVPLAFALIWSKQNKLPRRVFALIVCGVLLFCVFLSHCRTAYLSLGLTLLFMLYAYYGSRIPWKHLRISKYSLPIYGVTGGVTIILISSMLFLSKPLSAIGRILVWKVSLQMFLDSPITGIGFGNFSSFYNIYQGRYFEQGMGTAIERLSASDILEAFNGYLESTVEFGIVGFILCAIFWILVLNTVRHVFVRSYRLRKDKLERPFHAKDQRSAGNEFQAKTVPTQRSTDNQSMITDTITLGMAGSVLLFMIMALFYSTNRFTSIYLLYSVCLACVVSADQISGLLRTSRQHQEGVTGTKNDSARPYHSRRFFLVSFSVFAFLVSVTRIPTLYDQYKDVRNWYAAHTLSRAGQNDTAIELYYQAYPGLRRNERFLYDFGKKLLQAGREAEAITVLEQGTELWPSPYLFEDLATAYENTGDFDSSIKHVTLASHILPWRLTSQFMLADLYYRTGDTANASKYAQSVLDTPMKKITETGQTVKAKARILQHTLESPLEELKARRENAISLTPPAYQSEVRKALIDAGSNDMQLIEAIQRIDTEQRRALSFLLVNMPRQDLTTLSPDLLVTTVKYAFKTRSAFSYTVNVPDDIFLNYVLPYANLNERRDDWRVEFYERFIEIARNTSSAEETATILNARMFEMLDVQFGHRGYQEPVHSPFESIEKGFASCEGGSVLLADACRAVGIPSRLVFIPQWVDVKGGHVWVEVYDNGRWQCMAAFDAHDPTWPCKRASRTDPSKPEHRIYAVSFERTGLHMKFGPDVSLINVTDKYIH